MIEKFHIACKVVDKKLGDITGNINTKYIAICYKQFESHQKFLIDVLQKSDVTSVASAEEVKEHFEQMLLLRQIPQIENQTNSAYHSIIIQL